MEAKLYRDIRELHQKDPHSGLGALQKAYEDSRDNKAFWASMLAYTYHDDLQNDDEALNWFEISIAQGANTPELLDSTSDLYVKLGQLGRAEDFIGGIAHESYKNLLTARIFMKLERNKEAVEVLRSVDYNALDPYSQKLLDAFETENSIN